MLLDDEVLSMENASIIILDDQSFMNHKSSDATKSNQWLGEQKQTLDAAGLVIHQFMCSSCRTLTFGWPT